MRAIILMFDSLNRRMLPAYGGTETVAPNFERLSRRCVTFDTCYAGSMPCMPARRELHTGRYNFLHRGWSPLEPFDDSLPQILKSSGVYSHLITDHQHYWEDGGATYHNRYCSYEFFRGQEGDLWKADVASADPAKLDSAAHRMVQQDAVNRRYLGDEADHPQSRTFEAGFEFIETNAGADNWLLQIETFDPHEPFFSYDRWHRLYPDTGAPFDWPPYERVTQDAETVAQGRNRYLSLLSMCDHNLGRLLDLMDAEDMWSDTMLIVCTDHGYMLGEKGWWSKSVMPWYDETIHTPLFVWDPRAGVRNARRRSLVQTIDIAPTVLDFFGLDPTPDMEGRPLRGVIVDDTPVHEAGLFGIFGGHVCVTDGRHVYMRAPATAENQPLYDHTLMPTHMRAPYSVEELTSAELHAGFGFTKGAPVLKLPAWAIGTPWAFGTLLFDLETDPEQDHPLEDPDLERRMVRLLVDLMRRNEAPESQFERLGLPPTGEVTEAHLLIASQWPQVEAGRRLALRVTDFAPGSLVATVALRDLRALPGVAELLDGLLPEPRNATMRGIVENRTLVELAANLPRLDKPTLDRIEAQLRQIA